MGWATGNELFDRVMQILNNHVDEETREAIYNEMIPLFEEYDCDNLDELLEQDEAFDTAYKNLYRTKNPDDEDVMYGIWDDEDF